MDIWQTKDQSGNSPDATLQNARAEGVEDRVEIKDGDAQRLPFGDETFDLVLSCLALHNIYDEGGRKQALGEIVRVLKPGGQAAIVDIARTGEYEKGLRDAGMIRVTRSGPRLGIITFAWEVRAVKAALARYIWSCGRQERLIHLIA